MSLMKKLLRSIAEKIDDENCDLSLQEKELLRFIASVVLSKEKENTDSEGMSIVAKDLRRQGSRRKKTK